MLASTVVLLLIAGAALFYYSHQVPLGVTTAKGAQPHVMNPSTVPQVAERIQVVYTQSGAQGVADDIIRCYGQANKESLHKLDALRYCALYDMVAFYLDSDERQSFTGKFPAATRAGVPYFAADTFGARLHKVSAVAFQGWSESEKAEVSEKLLLKVVQTAFPHLHDDEPLQPITGGNIEWLTGPLPKGLADNAGFQQSQKEQDVTEAVRFAAIPLVGEDGLVILVQEPAFNEAGFAHVLMLYRDKKWRVLAFFRGGFVFNPPGGEPNDLVMYLTNAKSYQRLIAKYSLNKHKYVTERRDDIPAEFSEDRMCLNFNHWFWSLQTPDVQPSRHDCQ
jgi:hypothetical protein